MTVDPFHAERDNLAAFSIERLFIDHGGTVNITVSNNIFRLEYIYPEPIKLEDRVIEKDVARGEDIAYATLELVDIVRGRLVSW